MKRHLIGTLLAALMGIAMPSSSFGQVFVSVRIAPPIIPVYEQPICPAPGYLWTPGYWAYGPAGYYWVPGEWVQPPAVGLLWTPGYWGYDGGIYGWHAGYWGPHVGYYGGVNYGFGYTGVGFLGGMWVGGAFRYNTAVMRVGPGFRDVYVNRAAIVEGGPRYSYNGPGGWSARPTAADRIAERDHHVERTSFQASHEHAASVDRSARFSENHGRPANAAFRGGEGARPAARPAARSEAHPAARSEARPAARPTPAAREGGGHAAPAGRAASPAPRSNAGRAEGHAAPARGNPSHSAPAKGGRGEKGEEHHKN